MFSKKDFQNWGKQNAVLFAAVMTRIEGRKDDDLLRTYGFRGFPSMALLDADGEAITKTIPRDLYSMRNIVAAAPAYAKLSAAAEAGEQVDEKQWFLAQLGMGKLGAEEAKATLATLDFAGKAKKEAEQAVFVLEMTELMRKARARGAADEDRQAARQAVYAAFKAGMRLPAGASPEPFVDEVLVEEGKANADAAAFFFAYERVKAQLAERQESLKSYFPRIRADIEKNADNEQLLQRAKSTLARLEEMLADLEKQIADLEATAKSLKG